MKKKLTLLLMAAVLMPLGMQAQAYRESRYYNSTTGHLDYSRGDTRRPPRGGNMYGQGDIYYGLRIGPSFSTVNSDDKALDGGSSQTGLNIGVVAGLPLTDQAPLYLETGLHYTEKGGKTTYEGKRMTYDLNYLEVPVTVKYAVPVDAHFSIQPFLGGYVACGVGGKMRNYGDRVAESSFSKQYFKRFDGGLRVGCGVAYDMFYADLGYDLGLVNICHDEFDKSHNGCLTLTVGVNF